mmetsp:Transcript_25814/g.39042  ORF Transcript_25814/g.39042 Transcript_25814/m.39042 type:complete len:917 (+) Transcript_25814:97-2847(+)
MGNAHIVFDSDTFYDTDNSSRNSDSLSSYEILCVDETEVSQETDEESYEERDSIGQGSRNIIQISDPCERRAELERRVSAVKRTILNPLNEEIALIDKTKNDSNTELEVVLNENLTSASSQQDCVVKSSCFRDSGQVGQKVVKEPPRLHSMLVDPSLHLQVSDEIYGMRKSLEEKTEWKFSYAYHLERFRQLHSMIVNEYQMKLEELELHRFKLERYAQNMKKDNEIIRQVVIDCNGKITQLEKDAKRVSKFNQEERERLKSEHQTNTLKLQRRLKTSLNTHLKICEGHKMTEVERLAQIASLRYEIVELRRRIEVEDKYNKSFRKMMQAKLEEYITLSNIQAEDLEHVRYDNKLLKEESKALEFDLQSEQWVSQLQEDLAAAEMLQTQYKFRKEVIGKLTGNLFSLSPDRIEAKKMAYARLQKSVNSSEEDETTTNSKNDPSQDPKNEEVVQRSENQVEKETIDNIMTMAPAATLNNQKQHLDTEQGVLPPRIHSRDIPFVKAEAFSSEKWYDDDDEGSDGCKIDSSATAMIEVSDSGIEVVTNASQVASTSDDSSFTWKEQQFPNVTRSTDDVDKTHEDSLTPIVIKEQEEKSAFFIEATSINPANSTDAVDNTGEGVVGPTLINQREIFEFPGYYNDAALSGESTYSDFGIEVAAVIYTWEGREKHMPIVLEPTNGYEADDQFYISSIEASEETCESESETSLSTSEDISKRSIESALLEKVNTAKTDDLTKSPDSLYVTEKLQMYPSVSLGGLMGKNFEKGDYVGSDGSRDMSYSGTQATGATEQSIEMNTLKFETELLIKNNDDNEATEGVSERNAISNEVARDCDSDSVYTTVEEIDFFKPDTRDDDNEAFTEKDNKSAVRETFDFSLRHQNTFEFSYSPIEFEDNENPFVGANSKIDKEGRKVPDLFEL